jgi:site-specific DNA recombinase
MEQGYEIVATLREVHTGFQLDERPEMSELRAMMMHGLVDVIVVSELNRLSRKQMHTTILMYQAEKYGVKVEIILGPKWEDDAMGLHMMNTLALMAEMEREHIRDRTQRGLRRRVREGNHLGSGKPPYGYLWVDDRHTGLVIDPDTAPIVRRIFFDVCKGMALRAIAGELTNEGIPLPADVWYHKDEGVLRPWNSTTIARIVDNPIYTGEYVAFRKKQVHRREHDTLTGDVRTIKGFKLREEDDPTRIIIPNFAPEIVSRDVVLAAQKQLEANKQESARSNKYPEATLLRGGFAICGVCGGTMAQSRSRPKSGLYFFYRCSDSMQVGSTCSCRISAPKVDLIVWEGIKYVFEHLEEYEQELEKRIVNKSQFNDALEAAQKKLERLEQRRDTIKRALMKLADPDTVDEFTAQLNEVDAERKQVEKDVAEVAGEDQERLQRLKVTWHIVAAHKEMLDRMPYAGRRMLLRIMGIKVNIFPYEHTPRFTIQTHPEFHARFFAAPIFAGKGEEYSDASYVSRAVRRAARSRAPSR